PLPAARAQVSERAAERLLRQIRSLAPHTDWLLVDAGDRSNALAARLWSAADDLLLVTSPDAVAVMDTYSLIKTLLPKHHSSRGLDLVINQADSPATAADVHRRIDQSCRRFLGLSVDFAGAVPAIAAAELRTNRGLTVLSQPAGVLAAA